MKKKSFLFIIIFAPIFLNAQIQSIGFQANAIHNFSYRDNDFDQEKSIKLPILVLPSYTLEYNKIKPNRKLGFQAALGVVWEGLRIKRSFQPLFRGNPSNITISKITSGLSPSLRFGIFKQDRSFRLASGIHFRYFSTNSFVSISSAAVFDNESYQIIAEFEYLVNTRIHASFYINAEYKLFEIGSNEIRLNLIGNIGLHPIYRTTSIIEDFILNETKHIVHNNYGTYLGLGFKMIVFCESNKG
jgi:hypothetical protein